MTKRGYIVKRPSSDEWVIAEKAALSGVRFRYNGTWYKNQIPIHPSSLSTILDGDNLKPAYQGEVEYEVVEKKDCKCHTTKAVSECEYYYSPSCTRHATYAIPKVSEDKGDVWEEAWKEYRDSGGGLNDHLFLNYLKQHYTLTKI